MRLKNDQYFTPPLAVYSVLPLLADKLTGGGYIVEPSCGDGAIVRCLRNVGVPANRIIPLEIDPTMAAKCSDPPAHVTDTLRTDLRRALPGGADLIIGNPPYGLAEQFVKWGLSHLAPGGKMALLLRISFLGGRKRAAGVFATQAPGVAVLPWRPSFVRKQRRNRAGEIVVSSTDQYTYAWFIWSDSTPAVCFLPQTAGSIAQAIDGTGLQQPHNLYWRYRAPLVDLTGNVLEPVFFEKN